MAKSYPTVATGPKPRGFDRGNKTGGGKNFTSPVTSGPKQIKTVHPQQIPVTKSKNNNLP